METYRTPSERFADVDWREPSYVEVAVPGSTDGATLRMAYVDTGTPGDLTAPVALLLHGEPTWSYLYRHVVEVLVDAGVRCVVPDLVGFGRSDKPAEQAAYSYATHVGWMAEALLGQLELTGATLVGQDWGGLIGLLFLNPLAGAALGAGAGALSGSASDYGIPDDFIRQIGKTVPVGSGAVFILADGMNLDKLLPRIAHHGDSARVIQTSLSNADEARLRETLSAPSWPARAAGPNDAGGPGDAGGPAGSGSPAP